MRKSDHPVCARPPGSVARRRTWGDIGGDGRQDPAAARVVKGESISKIARETGLSRNTVKRYLRNAVLEPHYSARLYQMQPTLGPLVARLEPLLVEDEVHLSA